MLNTFPNLLTYGLFAPLLLRLLLGAFLIFKSYKFFKEQNGLWSSGSRVQKIYRGTMIVVAISGLLLVIGLFTQIAALLVLIITGGAFVYKKQITKTLSHEDMVAYTFVLVISFSLMLSGAGFYAIDLPL